MPCDYCKASIHRMCKGGDCDCPRREQYSNHGGGKPTHRVWTFTTNLSAAEFAVALIVNSRWFESTPMPDGRVEIKTKNEAGIEQLVSPNRHALERSEV